MQPTQAFASSKARISEIRRHHEASKLRDEVKKPLSRGFLETSVPFIILFDSDCRLDYAFGRYR